MGLSVEEILKVIDKFSIKVYKLTITLKLMISIMKKQAYVVEITIPEAKCPKAIRGRDKLISNGYAKVYLSRNTTANDCLNGIERWGISGGRNVCIYTEQTYPKDELEIKAYLKGRFGEDWEVNLIPTTTV